MRGPHGTCRPRCVCTSHRVDENSPCGRRPESRWHGRGLPGGRDRTACGRLGYEEGAETDGHDDPSGVFEDIGHREAGVKKHVGGEIGGDDGDEGVADGPSCFHEQERLLPSLLQRPCHVRPTDIIAEGRTGCVRCGISGCRQIPATQGLRAPGNGTRFASVRTGRGRGRLVAARRLTAPGATYYEMRCHTFPKRRGGRCPSAQAARRAPV